MQLLHVQDAQFGVGSLRLADVFIGLAEQSGLIVQIGSWVLGEAVEQRDWLKAMTCDYAQGFLFSEATPSGRFTEMLDERVRAKLQTNLQDFVDFAKAWVRWSDDAQTGK